MTPFKYQPLSQEALEDHKEREFVQKSTNRSLNFRRACLTLSMLLALSVATNTYLHVYMNRYQTLLRNQSHSTGPEIQTF